MGISNRWWETEDGQPSSTFFIGLFLAVLLGCIVGQVFVGYFLRSQHATVYPDHEARPLHQPRN